MHEESERTNLPIRCHQNKTGRSSSNHALFPMDFAIQLLLRSE